MPDQKALERRPGKILADNMANLANSSGNHNGDLSAALYGGIRKRRRDRTGEIIEDPALLHGESDPPVKPPTRRQMITRKSPVEWTDGERLYMEVVDAGRAYPNEVDEIRRAIEDLEAGRA